MRPPTTRAVGYAMVARRDRARRSVDAVKPSRPPWTPFGGHATLTDAGQITGRIAAGRSRRGAVSQLVDGDDDATKLNIGDVPLRSAMSLGRWFGRADPRRPGMSERLVASAKARSRPQIPEPLACQKPCRQLGSPLQPRARRRARGSLLTTRS